MNYCSTCSIKYCNTDSILESAVFEIKVFICVFLFLWTQSGRGAQDAFKGLSQSAVQSDGGAVYGELLNQMLKRSWPVENVDEDVSEGDLLRHVLTWPTWCGFLEFFGKCKRCITVFI